MAIVMLGLYALVKGITSPTRLNASMKPYSFNLITSNVGLVLVTLAILIFFVFGYFIARKLQKTEIESEMKNIEE